MSHRGREAEGALVCTVIPEAETATVAVSPVTLLGAILRRRRHGENKEHRGQAAQREQRTPAGNPTRRKKNQHIAAVDRRIGKVAANGSTSPDKTSGGEDTQENSEKDSCF